MLMRSDDSQEQLLASQFELCKRGEDFTGDNLVKVFSSSMLLDDFIEEEDLLFGLDTS
jgi:hypothetical protein